MQTAVGVFGGENSVDGVSAPPLMVENAGHGSRPAISSLNCPPFLAFEACREHLVLSSPKTHLNMKCLLYVPCLIIVIKHDIGLLLEPIYFTVQ